MPEAVTAHASTFTRVFDAPRELVWDAWTQPEQLAAWWGPPGWSTDPGAVTMDLRPGGMLRVPSVRDDGTEMTTIGVFREIDPPQRLVFDEPAEDAWHEGAISVLTLSDLGGGRTEMRLDATIHTTAEMQRMAQAGMAATFDRLATHLAR
jgi:uncharacterized protein YndB with AHSA1/START domain